MTLDAILGHRQSLEILRRAIAEERLPHALLFHGPEGIGKRSVAIGLAAALNCLEKSPPAACGACAVCTRIAKGSHPDVHYVTLERTVIPIDAIRQIRLEAASRPYEGRRRVILIDPADRMSLDAQNALLKTLEEPSPSTILVLVTTRPLHLLPTTRSRCQAIPFGTLPPESMAPHLVRARGLSEDDALRVARLSGGRVGIAMTLDLADHDAACDGLIGLLEGIASDPVPAEVPDRIDRFGADTEAIGRSLAALEIILRDLLILKAGGETDTLVHAGRERRMHALADRLGGEEALLDMADRIELARSDLERNVNRKILLETLLFDLGGLRAAS